MEKITVSYCLSEVGKRAAFLEGVTATWTQKINVDATAELLEVVSIDADGHANYILQEDHDGLLTADQASVLVLSEAAAKKVREAELKEREKAGLAAKERERSERDAWARQQIIEGDVDAILRGPCVKCWKDLPRPADDLPDDLRELVAAIIKADEKIKQDARDESEAANAEDKADILAEMAAWVLQHGSERLQLALNEGLLEQSRGVYLDERLALEWPNWAHDNSDDHKEVLNPSLIMLQTLAIERKLHPELKISVVRATFATDVDGDTPDSEHRIVCHVCLPGGSRWMYRVLG